MEKQKEFQEEFSALLKKYDVSLTVQEVPATRKIVVVPNKKEEVVTGTEVPPEAVETNA